MSTISKLLGPWTWGGEQFAPKVARNLIIDVVGSASSSHHVWGDVAKDLSALNAWSTSSLEEFDFEVRNAAMDNFNKLDG